MKLTERIRKILGLKEISDVEKLYGMASGEVAFTRLSNGWKVSYVKYHQDYLSLPMEVEVVFAASQREEIMEFLDHMLQHKEVDG